MRIGEASDARLSLINKLIQGVETIKNYVWEQPIIQNAQNARRRECRSLLKFYFWTGLSEGITRNASTLLGLPMVLLPLAQGKPLVASVIFTALSLADSIT